MPDETTNTGIVAAPVEAPATDTQTETASTAQSNDLSGFLAMGLDPEAGLGGGDKPAATPPAPAPTPKPAARPTAQPAPKGQPRATQLEAIKDNRVRELLRAMSNDAFAHFHDLALRLQNGEYVSKADHDKAIADLQAASQSQVASARYADHEDGYTLTPEYREAATAYNTALEQVNFWEEQMGQFAAGQPFRVLEKSKDGGLVPSQQLYSPKDNPSAMGILQSQLTRTNAELLRAQDRIQAMPKAHKEAYSKHRAVIDQWNADLFGKATNPVFKEGAAKYLATFPKAIQGDNHIQLIANLRSAGDILLQRIDQLTAELAQARNQTKAVAQGAPDPTVLVGQNGHSSPDDESRIQQLEAIAARVR